MDLGVQRDQQIHLHNQFWPDHCIQLIKISTNSYVTYHIEEQEYIRLMVSAIHTSRKNKLSSYKSSQRGNQKLEEHFGAQREHATLLSESSCYRNPAVMGSR